MVAVGSDSDDPGRPPSLSPVPGTDEDAEPGCSCYLHVFADIAFSQY